MLLAVLVGVAALGPDSPWGWKLDLDKPTDAPSPSYPMSLDVAGKHGEGIDASRFGIRKNVVTFYEHDFGLYPRVYDGKVENGGIPQRVNIEEHLARVRVTIEKRIPDPNWDGLAVIDYESWSPLFSGGDHFTTTLSKQLVIEERPGITEPELTRRARAAYESAARTFLEKTIRTCKELRPKARWGMYAYPGEYHAGTEQSLKWLWEALDVMMPSMYVPRFSVTGGQHLPGQGGWQTYERFVRNTVGVARRMAELGAKGGPHKPVIPFLSPRYFDANEHYAWKPLNDLDAEMTLRVPWLAGADGAIFWDYARDEQDAAVIQRYLDQAFGPLAQKFQQEVSERAKPAAPPGR